MGGSRASPDCPELVDGGYFKILPKERRSGKIAPGFMPMGSNGGAEMSEMEMALPDNTLPMMTGTGQFGPIEMGGMFSVVKVREGLASGDYKDPGPYKNPPGTVSYEFKGSFAGDAPRQGAIDSGKPSVELVVVKPGTIPGKAMEH